VRHAETVHDFGLVLVFRDGSRREVGAPGPFLPDC
jgi:hypothetical protein